MRVCAKGIAPLFLAFWIAVVQVPDLNGQTSEEGRADAPLRTRAGEQLSDREISLAVENELFTSEAVASHKIDVTSRSGIITLAGKVDNLLARQAAFELAQRVKGVRSVINQIVITPSNRPDNEIAEDILHAWSVNPATETFDLRVDVTRGTAALEGTVDSRAERQLARKMAQSVRGVVEIDDRIEVAYRKQRPDEEIREELIALLESDAQLADADLRVEVEDGDVLITGDVATSYAQSRVERLTWRTGVRSVDVRGVQVDPEMYDGTRRRRRMEQLTDERIVALVELALRHDPRVLSYLETIDVDSEGGSVTLTGTVGRLRAKQAAESTARGTLGVWRVKNNLKVRWADEDPPAAEIIDFVQAALKRDPYVSRHEIRVHCRNGHVSLYGLVDSKFEKKAAGSIAGGQKGVVHVNNYLSVAQRWVPKSDAEIKADIEDKLEYTFFDRSNQIEVTVEDGVAILRGEVDTWRQWQTAMEKAVEAGARRPHNLLKVRYHPRHGGERVYVPR